MRRVVSIFCILFFFLPNLQAQLYKVGDQLTVYALNGLNMRSTPSLKSDKVLLVKYGEQLEVLEILDESQNIEIGGVKGSWVKVKSNGSQGYVFDAYLSSLPPLRRGWKFTKNSACFKEQIDEYLINQLDILDTTQYYNNMDGEMSHSMEIIDLKTGDQFINHWHYESFDLEIQFNGVREIEVKNFAKVLAHECGLEVPTFEDELKQLVPRKEMFLNIENLYERGDICCFFSINGYEPQFSLHFTGGI